MAVEAKGAAASSGARTVSKGGLPGLDAAFLALAAIAAVGLALYLVAMPETRDYQPPTDHGTAPVPGGLGEKAA
ncbi:hypothetical protein [Bosea sp. TND4EK4]|uniref:hypothetical protein n=1 Tax=Bosea sp. TND4EK4 TaxID=1907408 RepID=UPI0009569047|nr:hypothetical protein [Bosea sp. TND4EK4]SIR16588.1 hypothetical protein SAMN05880592_11122 [Bosea sp. TND4EK4]